MKKFLNISSCLTMVPGWVRRFLAGTYLALFSVMAGAGTINLNINGGGEITLQAYFVATEVSSFLYAGPGNYSQDFPENEGLLNVTLVAVPDASGQFDGWGFGLCNNASTTCTFVWDPADDITLTPGFSPASYFTLSVDLAGPGSGQVVSSPADINCPFNCTKSYAPGATVTLSAVPDAGSLFTGWSGGGCSGSGNCILTMDNDLATVATFETDSDQDGVFDSIDQCPSTPAGETVNAQGCGASQLDDDNDGVANTLDQCPNTPAGETVNAQGCSASQLDDDNDGVANTLDQCPNTPAGETVNAQGCSASQLDSDGDGVANTLDQCPNTPAGESVNAQGCSASQLDSDGDGVDNTLDQCPNTPTGEAVNAQGCSASQLDDDNDGVANTLDQCPNTSAGETVNAQGCSASQLDSDGDGVDNALDQCPNTPAGESVNAQGCSASQLDSDGDGVDNALDQCPNTPAGESVNAQGCSASQLAQDADSDGVEDSLDQCPNTPAGETVNAQGCSASQLDSDGDGVDNALDQCPNTPAGESVNAQGCSASQLAQDADSDGVEDSLDQCPNTPAGETVNAQGCSASQLDSDGDGVDNALDQCPNTPAGESVNAQGCSASQLAQDADSDGVEDSLDQCPNTPAGETVNAQGCSASQLDSDGDGVDNALDQCPNTPTGEAVNAQGCSASQLDDDNDGVANTLDQCSNTPAGETVNAQGCSASQLDSDGDGVDNALDQCPNTPAGETVNAQGCSASQLDSDGDGVDNAFDQCPNTPAGETVNAQGCSASQLALDADNDGVDDSLDLCPGTQIVAGSDTDGCSEVQKFGIDLASVPGVGGSEKVLGGRIDEVCPALVGLSFQQQLSAGEQQLREACVFLKNRDTSNEQAKNALNEISLKELGAQQDYAIETVGAQTNHVFSRLDQLRSGGGGRVSVAGLNMRVGDKIIPVNALASAFEDILGIGASSDDEFSDFGRLGLFVQGDLEFGDRDTSILETGYDFDSWNVTAGGDYRFTASLYGGISLSVGGVEVDFDAQNGSSDIANWSLSLYGGWQVSENWYFDGLASYGKSDFDLIRNVRYQDSGGLFQSTHFSDTRGDQFFIGMNTGYMLNWGSLRIGPTGSISILEGTIDGFREQARSGDSDAWSFLVAEQDYDSMRLNLGLQADYVVNTSFGVLIPGFRATWVNESKERADAIRLRLANNPFAETDLLTDRIAASVDDQDGSFYDFSFNLIGQFTMGISGFVSYQFYSGYNRYSHKGVSFGLRWDRSF